MKVNPKLQKLSPFWYKRISRAKKVQGLIRHQKIQVGVESKTLNLKSFDCCIVGEAHLFNDAYTGSMFRKSDKCEKCKLFAQTFYSKAITGLEYSFNREINKFINHCIKIHGVNI